MRAYAHNSNISNLRFKTLSLLRWISYRYIDRKALRTQINKVIDNAIYWFGLQDIYIYKQKNRLLSQATDFQKLTLYQSFTYYIYKSILFIRVNKKQEVFISSVVISTMRKS